METQLVKWGNGQGIRIPRHIVSECSLETNDTVEMLVSQGRIVIQKPFRHKTLEERTAEYGGTLGPYREFEWGAPEGREIW